MSSNLSKSKNKRNVAFDSNDVNGGVDENVARNRRKVDEGEDFDVVESDPGNDGFYFFRLYIFSK